MIKNKKKVHKNVCKIKIKIKQNKGNKRHSMRAIRLQI